MKRAFFSTPCAIFVCACCFDHGSAATAPAGDTTASHLQVEVVAVGSKVDSVAAAEAPPKIPDGPLKTVTHYKEPGNGYVKGSPLYRVQQKALLNGGTATMSPVSAAMRCIINLAAQFFIVQTVLFVVQTLARFSIVPERAQQLVGSIVSTVFFAPMLCVLFLATRMRAVQLSQGQTEEYNLPQPYVKVAMYVCAWSTLAQTLFVALVVSVKHETWDDVEAQKPYPKALSALRYIFVGGVYGGFTVVCFGLCTMQAPEELWKDNDKAGMMWPSVTCTMILSVLFFIVHLCLSITQIRDSLATQRFGTASQVFRNMGVTLGYSAPMQCILFLAARLRALHIDPLNGEPQRWAQVFFYVCTVGLIVQTGLVVVKAYVNVGDKNERENWKSTFALDAVRTIAVVAEYVGMISVIVAICTLRRKSGETPAMPPSIRCTMILVTLFFAAYLSHFVLDLVLEALSSSAPKAAAGFDAKDQPEAQKGGRLQSTSTIGRQDQPDQGTSVLRRVVDYLDVRVKTAMDLAPMLCVLFMGAFLRAQQLTHGMGAPQGWCQDFMYIATWCTLLQAVVRVDEVFDKSKGLFSLRTICGILQYFLLILVHLSVIGIVVALFVMTPETANGVGSAMTLLF